MASGLDLIFQPFRQAHVNGIGYELADTLKPLASSSQPNRLRMIARSTNHAAVEGDVKNQIFLRQAGYQLPRAEGNAWTDVYVAYWKAIERLVIAEEASRQNGQVSLSLSSLVHLRTLSCFKLLYILGCHVGIWQK